MELARQTILIRELFADYQKNNPVTDAEIQAEYDKFVAATTAARNTRPATSWWTRKRMPKPSLHPSKRVPSLKTSPRSSPKTQDLAPRAAIWTGPTPPAM
jgi:hypothetical protein